MKISDNLKPAAVPEIPTELLDLALAWQKSKVLFAMVEFGLPTLLADQELTLQEVATKTRIHPLACDRLLNACVALKLLERRNDRYFNTALSKTWLVENQSNYLGDQFLNYDRTSYPHWSELTKMLREWYPGKNALRTPQEEDQGPESMLAQHNLALLAGQALGHAYDFSQHQRMLDLGGGTGAMSLGICHVCPNLQTIVYDLPAVIEVAEQKVTEAGLSERIKLQSGDFRKDQLPEKFDVVLLANLLSTISESDSRELFEKLYAALPEGGAVMISGWILDNLRTSPLLSVLFCLEDINWQVPDVEHTVSTYSRWLADAGFQALQHVAYAPPYSFIVGRR